MTVIINTMLALLTGDASYHYAVILHHASLSTYLVNLIPRCFEVVPTLLHIIVNAAVFFHGSMGF
jgi:hypothetical protein